MCVFSIEITHPPNCPLICSHPISIYKDTQVYVHVYFFKSIKLLKFQLVQPDQSNKAISSHISDSHSINSVNLQSSDPPYSRITSRMQEAIRFKTPCNISTQLHVIKVKKGTIVPAINQPPCVKVYSTVQIPPPNATICPLTSLVV